MILWVSTFLKLLSSSTENLSIHTPLLKSCKFLKTCRLKLVATEDLYLLLSSHPVPELFPVRLTGNIRNSSTVWTGRVPTCAARSINSFVSVFCGVHTWAWGLLLWVYTAMSSSSESQEMEEANNSTVEIGRSSEDSTSKPLVARKCSVVQSSTCTNSNRLVHSIHYIDLPRHAQSLIHNNYTHTHKITHTGFRVQSPTLHLPFSSSLCPARVKTVRRMAISPRVTCRLTQFCGHTVIWL